MQKIFSILLIIAVCFHPLAKASNPEILEETKIEKSTRNWTEQAKRLGVGLAIFGASYLASSVTGDDNIVHAIEMVSTYYIASSLTTFGRYCLEWYGESVAKAQHTSTSKGRQKGKITPQQSEKVERAAQENIRLTRFFLRQSQNLINAALKVGALYAIFRHNFSDEPINTALMASMHLRGLLYNIYEINYTYTTGQTRSDIPVLGILDGISEATTANQLFHYWQGPGLEIMPGFFLPIHQPLTSSQWAIFRFLQIHGDLQAIRGVFQIPSNIISGFRTYLKSNQPINERFLQQLAAPQPHHAAVPQGHQPLLLAPVPQPAQLLQVPQQQPVPPLPAQGVAPQAPQQIAAPQPHHAAVPLIQQQPAAAAPLPAALIAPQPAPQPPLAANKPQRQAAHDAAAPLHPQLPAAAPQQTPEELERNLKRQEALARIQGYHQASTIKKATINQEIRQLLAFLTNASLVNSTHGKRAIDINFGDGKSFRLIFEPPHAQNNAASDEYKGYRKERVLDALQVGYLLGWDQDKIIKFMNDNNIVRFYNIPLFLLHILWDRGQDEYKDF